VSSGKHIRCLSAGCTWRPIVNGRPGAEHEARAHRDETKARGEAHRDFLFVQYAQVRV
jgi:hypothetical protein